MRAELVDRVRQFYRGCWSLNFPRRLLQFNLLGRGDLSLPAPSKPVLSEELILLELILLQLPEGCVVEIRL